MAKPRIVVVGSSNTDMIVRVARLPRPGETLLGGAFATAAGGKGANQAVAAARAGGEVEFVGRVGADDLGRAALRDLARDGVGTAATSTDPRRPSGVALIFVAADGANCIAVAGGANAGLTATDVRRATTVITTARVLLTQLETPLPTVRAAIALAHRARVPVILNPAPAVALPDGLLRRVAILTPNETEAEFLTGVSIKTDRDAAQAARKLRDRGVGAALITPGRRGAYVDTDAWRGRVPGYSVKAIDTTAAGDVFNGALAVALAQGRPLPLAVQFANAAGALSVTRHGAQPSAPSRRAIEALLRGTH